MSGRPTLFLALLGIAALGATCKGADQPPPPPPPSPPEAPPPARPAVTQLEGIELAELPPAVRGDALRLMNESSCYCGCTRTVAGCLASRADCSCVQCSERMANFIMNEYKQGASTEDVEAQLLEGFSESYNARPKNFNHQDQPVKGDPKAPITLVEFADFRCPHCAAAFEVLSAFLAKRKDVKLEYYYFPLGGGGEESIRAAEAAEEAKVQGKFWQMSALLFRNQHALSDEDLMGYAKQAGLDLDKYAAAMKSKVHRPKIMEDKKLGEQVGIMSTPTIFVQGRRFGLARTLENLNMRIEMESERGTCR